jgi:FkbH-like protein
MMKQMKFSEIIKANNELSLNIDLNYEIAILSNVTISQIQPIFEYNLRKEEIGAVCLLGEYDNIIQDSDRFLNKNAVVIFWEACNIIDGFHYKVNLLSDIEFSELLEKTKNEIRYLFNKLNSTSVVIFNKFSSSIFNSYLLKENRFDEFCNKLNDFLYEHAPDNFFLISIDKIFNQLSITSSVDFRNYYTSKALYTIEFLKSYVIHTSEILKSIKGKTKKALILDCDNTLWDGIIGEDGIDGIKLDGITPKGVVFQEVQSIVKSLAQQGVVIGLCSKNNHDDVQEVFNKPNFSVLSEEDIVIKKINWNDKASNLNDIAKELNIGTDSLVFVDDSDFEINLVRDKIPNLLVSQVPKSIFEYPAMMMNISNLFYKRNITKEDTLRVKMYKEEAERTISKSDFADIDSYIRSLGLEITLFENDKSLIQRISQLTNKTNQFNLTTKRYTEADIENKMNSATCNVIALSVKDKFGDFGITGVAILETHNNTNIIDTFLLSCRVLGRKVEKYFLIECLNILFETNSLEVIGIYVPTPKNSQVKDFYLDAGFEVLEENNQFVKYILHKKKFFHQTSKIIKINYGK